MEQGREAAIQRIAEEAMLADRRVIRQGVEQSERHLRTPLPSAEGIRVEKERERRLRRPGQSIPRPHAEEGRERPHQDARIREASPGGATCQGEEMVCKIVLKSLACRSL